MGLLGRTVLQGRGLSSEVLKAGSGAVLDFIPFVHVHGQHVQMQGLRNAFRNTDQI